MYSLYLRSLGLGQTQNFEGIELWKRQQWQIVEISLSNSLRVGYQTVSRTVNNWVISPVLKSGKAGYRYSLSCEPRHKTT